MRGELRVDTVESQKKKKNFKQECVAYLFYICENRWKDDRAAGCLTTPEWYVLSPWRPDERPQNLRRIKIQ